MKRFLTKILALSLLLALLLGTLAFAQAADLPTISPELEKELCAAYSAQHPEVAEQDVFVADYYGKFGDCEIVLIGLRSVGYTSDMLDLKIGDCVFTFSSGTMRGLFLAYTGGSLLSVEEAYQKKLLTDAQLADLLFVHKRLTLALAPYDDVPEGKWFTRGIAFVTKQALMYGTAAQRFSPDAPMSRAMLITVLWRLAGQPEPDTSYGYFLITDVPSDDLWYAKAVQWAVQAEIINGYLLPTDPPVGNTPPAPTGLVPIAVRPNQPITREQLVTVLYRYAEKNGISTQAPIAYPGAVQGFKDQLQVSSWAWKAMDWAVCNDLLQGCVGTGNYFYLYPQETSTRAQTATILMRFVNFAKAD